MNCTHQIDLTTAAESYAVANTPLFLIRKLREDTAVHEIAQPCSGDDILLALKDSMLHQPTDFYDFVRPYVYLVALSLKETDEYLKKADGLENSDKWDWFNYVRGVLVQTWKPTNMISIAAPSAVERDQVSIHTDAPFQFEEIHR